MTKHNWIEEFDASITICNNDGIILDMNKKAIATFDKYGGAKLKGANLLNCHPEPARSKLKEMLLSEKSNIYTIDKKEIKKIVIQKPWYNKGKHSGFVEISIEIPQQMEHFVRE